jgi:putative peptidoglycan lipid II flippase
MTLISRILGFVRDVVIARAFGASMSADAFFVAFKIPNLFRRLFAEGAFAQAFVPVLAEQREQAGDEGVSELVGVAGGTLAAILMAVTGLGVIGAPVLIFVFAPGFSDETGKLGLAAALLRLTFPYLLLVSLTAFMGSVLNLYGRFAIPAVSPALLNIGLIGSALLLAPQFAEPVMALAVGVLIGGIAQLVLQYVALRRLPFRPRIGCSLAHAGVRKILGLMGPAVFGVSVAQISLMLDTIIASFLQTGSVSWLYYSDRLVEFPLGVFGIALATVLLPALSAKHHAGDARGFSESLDWALRWVFIIGIPAACGLATLATPMLSTLFEYGQLSGRDVDMASRSLVAYSGGLVAFILIKVLAPGYFSRQDTRSPVRIGVLALAANMMLNLILVFPLAHAGLALATTLSAFINAWLLWRGLRRDAVYRPRAGWKLFLMRVGLASGGMSFALWATLDLMPEWGGLGAGMRALYLLGLVLGGAGLYGLLLVLLGVRPRQLAVSGRY